MKTFAAIAILFTLFLAAPKARAQQDCYSPITAWQGNYTLTATGTPKSGSDVYSISQNSVIAVSNTTGGSPGNACQTWAWSGYDVGRTGSVNDTHAIQNFCNNGSLFVTNSQVGTTGSLGDSTLTIDLIKGTYGLTAYPVINAKYTVFECNGTNFENTIGASNWPKTNWPLLFPLPASIQPLTLKNFNFSAPTFFESIPVSWTLSFTLEPVVIIDDPCEKSGGSTISCQNQSLGEDVPLVGTGFSLHYESNRAPGAGGDGVASTDAFMIGGWTFSVHHSYDSASRVLFLGDGKQRNGDKLGHPLTFNGNTLLTSEDGSEVYVFQGVSGHHLQTLRPLKGALKYQFQYDVAGNLTTVTDGSGNVTTIQRDAKENATAIVSPYGQITKLTLDSHGFLAKVSDPLGKSVTFSNTSTGLLTSRSDENGNVYNYTYDSRGRLIKDADPVGGYTSLTRTNATSGFGHTVNETTAMGRTRSFQTTLNLPMLHNASSTSAEQQSNILPTGLKVTNSTSEHNGQLSKGFALPDGTSESNTQGPDPVWGIQVPVTTSETLSRGSLTMSISNSRSTTLGTVGNPFTVVSRTEKEIINTNRTYTSVFTGSNRTYVHTSPLGRTRTVALDSLERLASMQIGGLSASNFGYDTRGRLAAITQGPRQTTFVYDADGRLATVTDALGRKNSFTYDADGRLLSRILPDGRVIGYQHDANGNLTAVIPPGKSAHDFVFNGVNLISQYIPPSVAGSGPTSYTYNADRDITHVARPDGKTISLNYDSSGRLTSTITPTETINYTYRSTSGNLTGASITTGEALAYGYNGPLRTSTNWTGTISGDVSHMYDNNFWVTSRSLNGGNTITFAHDNDGLVTKAGALTLNHGAQNPLLTATTLGLATDIRTYNSFGEPVGYTASYNGAHLYSESYTRDALGRVTARTETIGGATNTFAYSYDLAGRLSGVTKNGTTVSNYSYDSNSNRVKAVTSSGTATATYDAQDRQITYGAASYTYTADGELATQKTGTQTTTYNYDLLGNLTSVTLTGGKAISYVVDAQSRRVGKKVNGIVTAGFLYDGDKIVAQLNGSNVIVSQFVYASGANAPDYMVQGGVLYRIFSDHLGSPRLVVNTSTGAIVEQINYDEFGNVLNDTKPGFQPFGFAGGLYDQDTKLIRFGARDYDPSTGRWTAKDPILFNGGDTNLYGYVLLDPVNLIDPQGLDCNWIKKLIDKFTPKKVDVGPVKVSTDKPEVSVGAEVGVEVDGQTVAKVGGEVAVGVTTDGGVTDNLFYIEATGTVKVGPVTVVEGHVHAEGGNMSNTKIAHDIISNARKAEEALCTESCSNN